MGLAKDHNNRMHLVAHLAFHKFLKPFHKIPYHRLNKRKIPSPFIVDKTHACGNHKKTYKHPLVNSLFAPFYLLTMKHDLLHVLSFGVSPKVKVTHLSRASSFGIKEAPT
jgi:hypothetical protein